MENGNLTSQPERLRRRTALACAAAIALSVGLSACVPGASAANERKAEQMNLANQRKAAVALLDMQGGVEKITFTREGGYPGFGASWRANAIVLIEGKDHNVILGFDLGSTAFIDPLPSISPAAPRSPVSIVYSDGSSEAIG